MASRPNEGCQCEKPKKKKLILCFDGTGNTFSGSNADTNVVKILNELDRGAPNQYFYYQTGIGTYDINESSVNKSTIGNMRSYISQTIDMGIGTTFDAHVMAGYRFLMRYYDTGDKIYMFGFSRGAFTARFLARMLSTVGLLCKGNEEVVPFAYRMYQKYLEGEIAIADKKPEQKSEVSDPDSSYTVVSDENTPLLDENGVPIEQHDDRDVFELASDEVKAFSKTFCRQELVRGSKEYKYSNVKVFFLGIWDCVSSVAVLEQKAPKPMPVVGTATYIRHAVAIDERRVKFKAALLSQDHTDEDGDGETDTSDGHDPEDIREVWFPGNHCDVGGGWPAVHQEKKVAENLSWWQRVQQYWHTRKPTAPTRNILNDAFQLSDISLAWMIREVKQAGDMNPTAALQFRKDKYGFMSRFDGGLNYNTVAASGSNGIKKPIADLDKAQLNQVEALNGFIHDTLRTRRGTGFFRVLLWKFLEYLPIITRWELYDDKWKNVRFPLNKGSTRDIPKNAIFHDSVLWRLAKDPEYKPQNSHGTDNRKKPLAALRDLIDSDAPCLRPNVFKEFSEERPNKCSVFKLADNDRPDLPIRHSLHQFTYV